MGATRQTDNPLVNKLAQNRLALGLDQYALAELSGVSRETIQKTEGALSVPSVAVALRLAETLGVQVEDLFQLKSSDEDQPNAVRARAPRSQAALLDQGARLDRIEEMLARLIERMA